MGMGMVWGWGIGCIYCTYGSIMNFRTQGGLQILRKRPLIFVHCYHHIATVLIVYYAIRHRLSIQWIAVVTNGGVPPLLPFLLLLFSLILISYNFFFFVFFSLLLIFFSIFSFLTNFNKIK